MKKSEMVWDLSPLYTSDNDKRMSKDRKLSEENVNRFVKKYRKDKKHLKNPKHLLKALLEYEQLDLDNGIANKEGYYWGLRQAQDQTDTKIMASMNKYSEFAIKLANKLEFFTLEISKIPEKDQKKFLSYKGLKNYQHWLEGLFKTAKYNLSESEEKILNIVGKTSSSNWIDMTEEFLALESREFTDEKGKKKTENLTKLISNLSSESKKTRDSSAKGINEILEKVSPIATKEINSILEHKRDIDSLRGLKRADQARHISDDIDTSVVDALVKAVSEDFKTSQNFYKFKAKYHKLKKLAYHERHIPTDSAKTKYSYERSRDITLKVFNSLDSELGEAARSFFDEKRIDVYPRKGKNNGAFCAATSKVLPSYILLNHTGRMEDLFTLAHELGHGVNNVLMQIQSPINYGTSLSTAEVASTFFEDFVFEEILIQSNEQERLSLMMKKVSDDIATIHRQIAGYRFELAMHSEFRMSGYLTKQRLGEIFRENMSAYMGKYVSQDKGSENWWVYWGHFRRFFYVYSYASGLLISKSLQSMVRENPKNIELVKTFLSKGNSASPSELFLEMGIDISKPSFWKRGLGETSRLLLQTEKLAKKLGKI